VGSQQPTNEWGGEEAGRSKGGGGGGLKDTCVCGVKARTVDERKKVESSNVMDPSLVDAANNNNTPSASSPTLRDSWLDIQIAQSRTKKKYQARIGYFCIILLHSLS
jgi:hypothetical protein